MKRNVCGEIYSENTLFLCFCFEYYDIAKVQNISLPCMATYSCNIRLLQVLAFCYINIILYHALQRNFDLCIPRKGIARPQSQFPHLCVCERSIYYHVRTIYFPAAVLADRSGEYINRSQKYECWNWDCSRAVPFLGTFVSNFRYCVFAVC